MTSLRASMYEIRAQRHQLRRHRSVPAEDAPGARASGAAMHLQASYGLTPREVEVSLLLAEGCSNVTVAERLGISPHTARHHTQRVLAKLGVHSRSAAGAVLRE
ncbi:MAG: LuxR C-terminal-related transcriptional regulator [Gemmatimonadales bacterium]